MCGFAPGALQLCSCFSVFHKCENTEFTQVKNVATCIPALLQEDFILLCGRVREAFLLISSVFCLYRERERERGSVRRSEREREREREKRRGGVYTWCVVYVAMVPVRPSTLGVYTYAKITHTYVRLHSCVTLHLALSMNAAANFCSPIKIFATILLQWGGKAFFHLTRAREREREGGREGGRWRMNGREREREGGI